MSQVKKRDAETSIRNIIEAGKTIFAEKGYDKTTFSDIAKECGLSRSTPSYFFKNKQYLYKEVIETLIKDEKEYVDKLHPEKKLTINSLKKLLSLHMDYTFENPYLTKILIWESLNRDRHHWIYDYFPDMITWSHKYLEEAQKQGLIRDDFSTQELWLNAMAMSWLPIITQNTFFKSIGKEFDDSYIDKYKKQVEKLIFEGICKNR
jgi:AcrR family transcriptional regulator